MSRPSLSIPLIDATAGTPTKPSSLPLEGSRDTGDGLLVSVFPDVCLTPIGGASVPIPYTIHAYQSDDASTTPTVTFTGERTHTARSIITKCYGDEKGKDGGVISGTHNSICEPMTWSETVTNEGYGVVRHQDYWFMNRRNTIGKVGYTKDVAGYKPILLAQNASVVSDAPPMRLPNMPEIPSPAQVGKALLEKGGTLARGAASALGSSAIVDGAVASAPVALGLTGAVGAPVGAGVVGISRTAGLAAYYTHRNPMNPASAIGLTPFLHIPYQLQLTTPQTAVAGGGASPQGMSPEQRRKLEAAFLAALAAVSAQTQVRVSRRSRRPCAQFACGIEGSKYKGGAHWCIGESKEVRGDGRDSHHTPAKENSYLSTGEGPAIQMDPSDHYNTWSNGKPGTHPLMRLQKSLIDNGNWLQATSMDLVDIRTKFGKKYDGAIAQMMAYTMCLKQLGRIK